MKSLSERSLLLLLAAVQFTHIVDFMVMMPLGPQLMRDLQIGPQYFSTLVAAYTVSSGVIGLLTAPFIDRFDRRKLLLARIGLFDHMYDKNSANRRLNFPIPTHPERLLRGVNMQSGSS